VMSDVAGRIIGQFADNLEGVVAAGSGTASSAQDSASPTPVSTPAPAAEAIDMMQVAGGAVAKKLIPVAIVILVIVAGWLVLG
jgi:uncharacterized protein